MKTLQVTTMTLLVVLAAQLSRGDDIVISMQGNGILTWKNTYSNALFTIEWTPALGPNPTSATWTDSWTGLKDFWIPAGAATVQVPMFYRVRCLPALVRFGDAFFGDTSDQAFTNSYWPMPAGQVLIYDGYGDYAGHTIAEEYSLGERVGGVKTVKMRQTETRPGKPPADGWAAFDILGDLRLLKAVEDTNVFEVAPTNTPPLIFPANPRLGLSWKSFDGWKALTATDAAFRGYTDLVQLQSVWKSWDVDYEYFSRGVGRVYRHWNDNPPPTGSGWRLRTP